MYPEIDKWERAFAGLSKMERIERAMQQPNFKPPGFPYRNVKTSLERALRSLEKRGLVKRYVDGRQTNCFDHVDRGKRVYWVISKSVS